MATVEEELLQLWEESQRIVDRIRKVSSLDLARESSGSGPVKAEARGALVAGPPAVRSGWFWFTLSSLVFWTLAIPSALSFAAGFRLVMLVIGLAVVFWSGTAAAERRRRWEALIFLLCNVVAYLLALFAGAHA